MRNKIKHLFKWLTSSKDTDKRDFNMCWHIAWFFNERVGVRGSKDLEIEISKVGTPQFDYELTRLLFARDIMNLNKSKFFKEHQLRFIARQAENFYKKGIKK